MKSAERRLSTELHRLVDEWAPTEVDLQAILEGRPRRSQHPVRTVVLAVVAVLVAVLLPLVAIILFDTTTSIGPAKRETPSPTGSAPTSQATVAFSLNGLSTGPAPSNRFLFNGLVSSTHVDRVPPQLEFPGSHILDFAPYKDGWIDMVELWGDGLVLCVESSQGRVIGQCLNPHRASWNSTQGLTRSEDGFVAVSFNRGEATLIDPAGKVVQTWRTGIRGAFAPLAVLPDHSVILYAGWQGEAPVETVRAFPAGTLATLPEVAPVSVNPVNGDLSMIDASGCAEVVDLNTGQPRWRNCDYAPGFFSADGSLMATTLRSISPFGPRAPMSAGADSKPQVPVLLLRAATGEVQRSFILPDDTGWGGLVEPGSVWEDSTHLLVTLYSSTENELFLIRFGLDGTVEKVDVALVQKPSSS